MHHAKRLLNIVLIAAALLIGAEWLSSHNFGPSTPAAASFAGKLSMFRGLNFTAAAQTYIPPNPINVGSLPAACALGQSVFLTSGGGPMGIYICNGLGTAWIPIAVMATTYAKLTAVVTCGATTQGAEAFVTDASVNTWGSNVTAGGGADPVGVSCNGTNWTVLSK